MVRGINDLRQKLAQRVRNLLLIPSNLFKWAWSYFTLSFSALSRVAHGLWYGTEEEKQKVLVYHATFGQALQKCAVHFLPIAVVITLAGFNLGGYFIGAIFTGPVSRKWQDFDSLGLQVSAKLVEFLIIASIANLLMDVLRHMLIFTSDGLPLGLIASKTLFTDLQFLFSPAFRHGICGVNKAKVRWALALFLTTCTILALLVGPSSALLLIPQWFDNWPAGGGKFYLLGSNESIWPSQLDIHSVGGTFCEAPNETILALQQQNMSSCIWAGYMSISQWFQATHCGTNPKKILFEDGVITRHMVLAYSPLSISAFSVTMASCLISEYLMDIWYYATFKAPKANSMSLQRSYGLTYAARGGSVISMNSTLPVVRTTCLTNDTVTYSDTVNNTYYPLQLEYPIEYLAESEAPNPPLDLNHVIGHQYSFDATSYANSSQIASIWLETPKDEPLGTNIKAGVVTGRSSAYLNVQIPSTDSNSEGLHAACSIDARWVQSTIFRPELGLQGPEAIYTSPWFSAVPTSMFPALNDGNWRPVRLGIDWLNVLTPSFEGPDGWNALSTILTDMGLRNNTGLITDVSVVGVRIASVVSALVADGMSRTRYSENGGNKGFRTPNIELKQSPSQLDDIIDGSYVFNLPGEATPSGNLVQIDWSITVTGRGYKANSMAYYLALTVLFIYASLALAHMVWVFTTYKSDNFTAWRYSTSWISLMDLFSLGIRSNPPDSTLLNAGAGIDHFRTFQAPVRVRATNGQVLAKNGTSQQIGPKTPSVQAFNLQDLSDVTMTIGSAKPVDNDKKVLIGKAY